MSHERDEFGNPIQHDDDGNEDPLAEESFGDPEEEQDFLDTLDPWDRQWAIDLVAGQGNLDKTEAAAWINAWADNESTFTAAGIDPSLDPTTVPPGEQTAAVRSFPTLDELLANPSLQNGLAWMNIRDNFPTGLPPIFQIGMPDGSYRAFRYDPLTGAVPFNPVSAFGGPPDTQSDGSQSPFRGIPVFGAEDIFGQQPTRGRGTGRSDRTFDKAQLRERGGNMWRSLLLDIDADQVDGAVNDYVRRANGFWRGQGGNLDFDTFMLERIRSQDRYSTLYAHKPTHLSEGQWIASHTNAVNSVAGLRPGDQRRELETSLTSGGSLAGQQQRIQRSERAFRANPSAFTTRLANTVARLGPGGAR